MIGEVGSTSARRRVIYHYLQSPRRRCFESVAGRNYGGLAGIYYWTLFFFKQKTAYEIGQYWSSDVCSSDLSITRAAAPAIPRRLASHAGCASWVSRSAV